MNWEKIEETVTWLQDKITNKPEVGIVLGSGLGNLTNEIDITEEFSYSEIPNFPVSTVKGHGGKLIFGSLSGKRVVAMSGRFHFYEGYDIKEVIFPIRVMRFLGSHSVVISNASGGIGNGLEVGDVVMIEDHINLQPVNPLRGFNDERIGPRFPDMLHAYDKKYRLAAIEFAENEGIELKKGVYVGVQGPTFETPAEYKAFHFIGGDLVGMSTVPEVIAAIHCGLKVFAISVVADIGYPPDAMVEINHDMVVEAAVKSEPVMTKIVAGVISRM